VAFAILTPEKVQEELRRFESSYGMSSMEFLRRFESGEFHDDLRVLDWEFDCELAKEYGIELR
jgi:hypothetical protein